MKAQTSEDLKRIVEAGYDACGEAYVHSRRSDLPQLRVIESRLSDGSEVLDVGCGGGLPVCGQLAIRHKVTGVDISAKMIEIARGNVPGAEFIHADAMECEFAPGRFDAIISLYAVIHVPREEQGELLERFATWLKPGGLLMVSVAAAEDEGSVEGDYFGTTMAWSSYGLPQYLLMLQGSGLEILSVGELGHGYQVGVEVESERHPLIFARKPAGDATPGSSTER